MTTAEVAARHYEDFALRLKRAAFVEHAMGHPIKAMIVHNYARIARRAADAERSPVIREIG